MAMAGTLAALCLLLGARAEHSGDELGLLQVDVHAHSRQQRAAALKRVGGTLEMLRTTAPESRRAMLSMDMEAAPQPFNCTAVPGFCRAPFNCQTLDPNAPLAWALTGFAHNGVPNRQVFCLMPEMEPFAAECAQGNLDKAAYVQYLATNAGFYGATAAELDASACFINGHCADQSVTNTTTLEEATALCDQRFGRQAWSGAGSHFAPAADRLNYTARSAMSNHAPNGFSGPNETRPTLLANCAMGTYHCDVMLCKNYYCKTEPWVRKYGHFLRDLGWTSA